MDSKEFDNLLGDKLGAEQSFDFHEPDWVDLSQKLDEEDQKKWLPFWFWKSMLTLVVLGTIAFLWFNLQQTKKTVQELQLNMAERNVTITDTVYHKITIISYDTIQKIIYVEKLDKRNFATEKIIDQPKNKISNFSIVGKNEEEIIKKIEDRRKHEYHKDELVSQKKSLPFLKNINNEKNDLRARSQPALVINFHKKILLQSQSLDFLDRKKNEVLMPEDQGLSVSDIQKVVRKKRFSIGLLSALDLPKKQTILGYTPGGFFNYYSQSFGLRTAFKITDSWSLTGDASRQKTNFKTNASDFLQPVLFTEELITGVDTLKVEESKYNYAIGLKYFLRNQRKIQPYTSIRLEAVSGLKQKISGWIPASPYQEAVFYESTGKKSGFTLQSIETAFGFQYYLKRNISWQAEGNYHFYLDEIDDEFRSNISFKTSFLFHF